MGLTEKGNETRQSRGATSTTGATGTTSCWEMSVMGATCLPGDSPRDGAENQEWQDVGNQNEGENCRECRAKNRDQEVAEDVFQAVEESHRRHGAEGLAQAGMIRGGPMEQADRCLLDYREGFLEELDG